MAKLTKRTIDELEAQNGKPSFLWDNKLAGFGVKCLPTGAKRYVVKYRSGGGGRSATQRWLTLGTHGQLTAEEARKLAQQALAAVARGDDPQDAKVKKRAAKRVSDVWERFRDEHLPSRKAQTRYEYESQWRTVLEPKLGRMRAADVSQSDVDALHKGLRLTPYRANRILALLSRLMTLAELWGIRPAGTNPCRHVERFKECPRNRYLSGVELDRLGEVMRSMVDSMDLSQDAANAVRLLLLTGARLSEILAARWEWIDRKKRAINLPDSKTGPKAVFLSRSAIRVLIRQRRQSHSSAFIFPGTGADGRLINLRKSWTRICAKAELQGVRLHDLRHTAASVAVGQGASLAIIGRLLGHSQPRRPNVTPMSMPIRHEPPRTLSVQR